ncbi:rhodanese family protein [Brevundimonas sp. UBA7534]|uniref:rhodanese family protein n=1 Tax=Brevundimonas sp. UBA7534 TaxID=1946138 RepID=UPI0025C58D8C|nr:rhodanese family protein [Brevundimonas sp. UBA7534]
MTTLTPLKPADVAERLKKRRAVLIDIREADEFARERVSGAVHAPLSRIDASVLERHAGRDVIYTCRTGNRTGVNGVKLAGCAPGEAFVLEGGLDAWKAQGLPIHADRSQPIELMRQVQMTAGGLVLIGAALGLLVHPAFWGLAAFVGAGLFFAGATGFCGMARLLAAMPWNRKALGAV